MIYRVMQSPLDPRSPSAFGVAGGRQLKRWVLLWVGEDLKRNTQAWTRPMGRFPEWSALEAPQTQGREGESARWTPAHPGPVPFHGGRVEGRRRERGG